MKRAIQTKAILAGILISSLGILSACNDDDDGGTTPPAAPNYPVTLSYHSITNTDLMLWVGGVEINTEGMDASALFDAWMWEPMDESYWEGNAMVFESDSAFMEDLSEGAPYYFSNDSLFGLISFFSGTDTIESFQFLGTGDLSEIRFDQGAASHCITSGSNSNCAGFGRNTHLSLQDAFEVFDLSAVDEMGANDSLIIYNQTVVFRP